MNIGTELINRKISHNLSNLTPQETRDILYIPLCLECVALNYLQHLRMMMFVPGSTEAKWLGRAIENNIREFDKALNNRGVKLNEPTLVQNTKRYDDLLVTIMPRKFIYKKDSPFSPYINAISNGIKEIAPNGLEYFNGYESDTMAKAYFCYRLIHLSLQAEGQAIATITGNNNDIMLSDTITQLGAACVMVIEYLGGLRKRPTETKSAYVKRVTKNNKALQVLNKHTYDVTVDMIDKLQKIHIE